jgi:hypothetical protein
MAFASLVHKPMDALLVTPDPVLTNRHVHLVLAAMYHRIPAIYFAREFVEAGGLHATRRCGGNLAARSAGAAGGNAGDRIAQPHNA